MPVIIKLIPRRRQTWVELVLQGADSIRLPVEHVPAGIAAGTQLADDEWQELQAAAEYYALRDRALRILARREHFRRELEIKLSRHCRDRDMVGRVLANCITAGYLDDERAAGIISQNLLARGGIGAARLKHELFKRGCPAELISATVAACSADLDEAAGIARLLAGRRRSFASRLGRMRAKLAAKQMDEHRMEQELRRQLSAAMFSLLAGRGFGGSSARQAVTALVDELLESAES